MKAVLLELDDDLVSALERVAPPKSRRRSEFVRAALRRALWDLEEKATAEAYRRQPDTAVPVYFNPAVWDRTGGLVRGRARARVRSRRPGRP